MNYKLNSAENWEEISKNRFLNIYRIFEDGDIIKELELRQECIKQQGD